MKRFAIVDFAKAKKDASAIPGMMPTESSAASAQRWPKSQRFEVFALLAFSVILMIGWTFAVPVFESPDESSHWQIAQYIHDNARLPHYDQSIVEGNQPPIYYVLIAPFAHNSADPPACVSRVYTLCRAYFGRYWPLRKARILTALLSALTVLFVYMAGIEMSGSRSAAVLAGMLVICLPEFAFRGGNISNDGMVATTSALGTYWIIRLMRRGFTVRSGIIASLCVALAFLTKISAIILVPVLAVILISFPGNWGLKLKRLSVMLAAAVCVAPWLIRNQMLYGDPLASKAMLTAVPMLIDIKPLWSPWFLQVFPAAMGISLVGAFGNFATVHLPRAVIYGFGCLVLVAFAGLLRALIRRQTDWKINVALFALVLLAIASAVQLNMTISQPQGRYFFAGLPALALLTAMGLGGLPGWNRALHYAMLGGLGCVALYALLGVEVPAFWRAAPGYVEMKATDSFLSPPEAQPAGPLLAGNSYGQTFVSTAANLSSVEVQMATYSKRLGSGLVKLHLRASPTATEDIASVTLPASEIMDNSFVPLKFAPISDSKGRTFYFLVETEGLAAEDALTIWISKSDNYLDGQFYRNGQPTDFDMILRTIDTNFSETCGDCEI